MLNQLFILFISFGIADAIDILLVAIMLYQLYKMVKGTAAVNVFIGLALIYVVWIIVRAFDLKLLSSILKDGQHLPKIRPMVLKMATEYLKNEISPQSQSFLNNYLLNLK